MKRAVQILKRRIAEDWILSIGLVLLCFGLITILPAQTASAQEAEAMAALADGIEPEGCVWCHGDDGGAHRDDYVKYIDKSTLGLAIDSVTSTPNSDGTFTTTAEFTIKKNGLPYIDEDGLPTLEQKRFYSVTYDSATGTFDNSKSFSGNDVVALGDGRYSVSVDDISYAPEQTNGQFYAYIADGPIHTEPAGHVHLYDDVANTAMAFGDVGTYKSPANVEGCEGCHGKPYMKHGYRDPVVAGLGDFSTCKSCHYDTRRGGHQDWQMLVDNPPRYAELDAIAKAAAAAGDRDHDSIRENMTEDELARYAYTANLMNDVHMAHAMEFPYPQSMTNCATCHEGKLDRVLADANFTGEVCLSCHAIDGPGEELADPHRAPALNPLMPATHRRWDLEAKDCSDSLCHAAGGDAAVFSEYHSGYNPVIYADTAGTKYSDKIVVTIDSASLSGTDLTFSFSATGTAGALDAAEIHPDAVVALYGYDTKDFIVNGHSRYDANNNGTISRRDGDLPKLEYSVGTEHGYFTTVSAEPGAWSVTADLSEWADMINDGVVRRVELAVLPTLRNEDGDIVALNAPSRTFDLGANGFDDAFYSDIVDVAGGCNDCHDALATTFHAPNRGGNITVCRTCHMVRSGASHLELQSRSIDSFVHAIHSFQDFDIADIDLQDPVEAVAFEHHIAHTFPNFTIRNCQACHVEGSYEVPDQTKSLPGILSGSDVVTAIDRNIQDVPSYVTGPAARACGGCHRADLINEDAFVRLLAFERHVRMGGYLVEDQEGALDAVIESIMETLHQ